MIFSIIVILLVGVVAFFHYVQGLFSATISTMCAILAAVLAVSYHETVVNLLLKGKMADYAHGLVLCMIFVVVYSVLRVIFDSAVPGNVRTPNVVDKIGAGLMGLIAGIFTVGIFTIAAQTLPFDPGMSLLGYARQPVSDMRKVIVPQASGRASLDSQISGEMIDPTMDPEKEKGLLLPVDDMVLATVYHLSDGGSLAGDRPLASVHPDYLEELFGERLGIQTAARRVALQISGNNPIEVSGVFSAATLPAVDGGVKEIRPTGYATAYKGEVKPGPGQVILVVRVKVHSSATDDDDSFFRFSTGSIHLVGQTHDGAWKDYFPIGTLENGNTVLMNKPDDFLFIKPEDAFDAVFVVDESLLQGSGKSGNVVRDGVFISVKRFGLVDLAGENVKTPIVADQGVKVIRSGVVVTEAKVPAAVYAPVAPSATPSAQPGTPQSPSASVTPPVTPAVPTPGATPTPPPADTAIVPAQPAPGKELSADDITAVAGGGFLAPGSISLGTTVADQEAKDAPVAGGKISLTGGQISSATVDPTATLSKLNEGTSTYSQLFCPQDRTIVQVAVHPYTTSWLDWMSQYGKTSLVDSNGNPYTPNGVYALAKGADGRSLFLRYDAKNVVSVSPPDAAMDGTVYFIFLVPSNTDLKSFTMGGKTQNLSAPLHVP